MAWILTIDDSDTSQETWKDHAFRIPFKSNFFFSYISCYSWCILCFEAGRHGCQAPWPHLCWPALASVTSRVLGEVVTLSAWHGERRGMPNISWRNWSKLSRIPWQGYPQIYPNTVYHNSYLGVFWKIGQRMLRGHESGVPCQLISMPPCANEALAWNCFVWLFENGLRRARYVITHHESLPPHKAPLTGKPTQDNVQRSFAPHRAHESHVQGSQATLWTCQGFAKGRSIFQGWELLSNRVTRPAGGI